VPRDTDFLELLNLVSYDPFVVVDSGRRIIHFNDPFVLMLGLRTTQRRRVEGTVFNELLRLDETGQACITDCLSQDRNVRVQSVDGRVSGGRQLVLDMSALPLRNETGQVTGVLILHRDVTDEQRLKERYNEEKKAHLAERESLLRIISDRDAELKRMKRHS